MQILLNNKKCNVKVAKKYFLSADKIKRYGQLAINMNLDENLDMFWQVATPLRYQSTVDILNNQHVDMSINTIEQNLNMFFALYTQNHYLCRQTKTYVLIPDIDR